MPERLPSGEQASKALERARRQPLTSPALGTAGSDLVEPCAIDEPRAAEPPLPVEQPLALAFSGGGFRASLAALGVLRLLADAGLLGRVRYVSSASGGSVAHGLFARHYDELEREGFRPEALDRIVIEPFIERISEHSLIWALIRNLWRIIGSWLPSMWRSPPHPPHRGANPHRMRGRGDPASDNRLRHMAPQAVTWRRLLPTRSSLGCDDGGAAELKSQPWPRNRWTRRSRTVLPSWSASASPSTRLQGRWESVRAPVSG